MPYRKLYFAEGTNSFDDTHAHVFITADGELYIEVATGYNGCELQNIILTEEDAISIASDIADDLGYDLVKRSPAKD